MRKRITAIVLGGAFALSIAAAPAVADPSFGPGNNGGGVGNSGPQGAKCHPPGQTTDTPGCK